MWDMNVTHINDCKWTYCKQKGKGIIFLKCFWWEINEISQKHSLKC